ncbi:hypothetical protein CsSME_00051595 [Camellia sinensis var. sinensis]
MKILKGYVRNHNCPEGCIAESYIVEKAVEFCAEYLSGVDAIGILSNRNMTVDDDIEIGRPLSSGYVVTVDRNEWEQAHRYMLENTSDIQPYVEMDTSYVLPTDGEDAWLPATEPTFNKRKGRGSTTLPNVIKDRSSSVRKAIDYNENGQLIGYNSIKCSSYLGVLARTMILICYKDWFEVPAELKEKLWSCVELTYKVDERSKKNVLPSICSKWRTFKKELTKYICENKSNLEIISNPPAIYGFIEQRCWDSFLVGRLSEEFEVKIIKL